MEAYYKVHSWIINELGFNNYSLFCTVIYNAQEKNKECYISLRDWAKIASISKEQAIRIIKHLEKCGYISIKRTRTEDNGNERNCYTVNTDAFRYFANGE